MAILSFADKATENFYRTGRVRKRLGWANIRKIVRRKLDMVHYATKLSDLKAPPNNHLEVLTRELEGYHSIRISAQWRVVFRWTDAGATELKVIDYH